MFLNIIDRKMVRDEIKEGLKEAVNRGESLRQAMVSFYNAGYKKQDIEEAARAVQMEKYSEQIQRYNEYQRKLRQQKEKIKKEPEKQPLQLKKPEVTKPEAPKQTQSFKPLKTPLSQQYPQKISKYESEKKSHEEKQKSKGKLTIIILIVFLVLLLVILASVFLFKESIMSFFDNLFS